MTDYTRIRNTLMSNPNGIMESTLCFGLQGKVKSNVRMYFYKYNVYDLVEVEYDNDVICVFDFKHTEDKAIVIRDELDFYAGYFKSAGLQGKRFLFDVSFKLPVNYDDFIPMNDLPSPNNREFAFVLDKKTGYISEKSAVTIFIATERTDVIDKCVLSFMNNSINSTNPKSLDIAGCMNSIVISGLLSGLPFKDIEEQLDIIDLDSKFMGTINALNYSSKFINDTKAKLKIDKFKRVLQKSKPDVVDGEVIVEKALERVNPTEKVNLKGEISLRDIVDEGLDRFMKTIKNPKDVMKICIDTEYQTIRSAYIVKGIICITPVTLLPISYFKELLNSDNVEYVLN